MKSFRLSRAVMCLLMMSSVAFCGQVSVVWTTRPQADIFLFQNGVQLPAHEVHGVVSSDLDCGGCVTMGSANDGNAPP